MKKLLALVAILPAIALSGACFGVDWIKDKIYTSSSYSIGVLSYSIGYHYTDSVKISVEPMIFFKPIFGFQGPGGILANLRYHYEFTNTDITAYVNAGIGALINVDREWDYDFLYKISSGLDLPFSSRANGFAGYRLLKGSKNYAHGFEFGINYNL